MTTFSQNGGSVVAIAASRLSGQAFRHRMQGNYDKRSPDRLKGSKSKDWAPCTACCWKRPHIDTWFQCSVKSSTIRSPPFLEPFDQCDLLGVSHLVEGLCIPATTRGPEHWFHFVPERNHRKPLHASSRLSHQRAEIKAIVGFKTSKR